MNGAPGLFLNFWLVAVFDALDLVVWDLLVKLVNQFWLADLIVHDEIN